MKLKITADCWDESDLHYFYPKSRRKPMLKEGQEFLYDGEEYNNFYGVWYVLHLPVGTYYIDPCKAQIGGDIPAWVAVDENDLQAFLFQRAARLRSRVVKLSRLPYDDRAGPYDHDFFEIFFLRHGSRSFLARPDHRVEIVKQAGVFLRPRRRLWVILHGKDGQFRMADALHRAVVD